MTAPDRILSAGVIRLVVEEYRDQISTRNALIEVGHPNPAALTDANRITACHLAVADAILSTSPRRRRWWWPW